MLTLEVEYQVLVNFKTVSGNYTLNDLGISVYESINVTSGKTIEGGGQWCAAGGLCSTPYASMTSSGMFWDQLSANPGGSSTANKVFHLYSSSSPYTLPVINYPGGPTILNNSYSSSSIRVASGALTANSRTQSCVGVAGAPGWRN